MAILLGLANELLLQILDSLTPIDMVSFATSCKQINTLAQDNLSLHRQRIKKYQNVTLWGCFRHQDQPHPISLLRDICNDWRVAYYARSLAIECCGKDPIDPDAPGDNIFVQAALIAKDAETVKRVLPEITIPVRKKLSMALRWDEAKINNALDMTEHGARGAILGLLIVSLPAIKSISFNAYVWSDELWIDSMKSITEQQETQSGSSGAGFLMNLSELNLDEQMVGRFGGMFCSIVPFVTLPSLRVIRGASVESRSFDDSTFANNHGLSHSPVTEIDLQRTFLPVDELGCVLRYVYDLRRFRYDRGRQLHNIHSAEPGRIVKVLLAYASHSLESLALTGAVVPRSGDDEDIKGSLRDFKVLNEINFPSNALLTSTSKRCCTSLPTKDIPRLVDILPASIERVMLEGGLMWANLAALLIGMPENKTECLPKLKEILFTVERDQKSPQKQAEARAHLERKQGIVLQIDQANGDARCYPGRVFF